jgi:hypothetical protein
MAIKFKARYSGQRDWNFKLELASVGGRGAWPEPVAFFSRCQRRLFLL